MWNKISICLAIGMVTGYVNAQSPLVNISQSGYASVDPVVAVNPQGQACTVWVEEFSSTSSQVYYSVRGNGSWSSPARIPGQGGNSHNPHISRGRGGNGFSCVWRDSSAWRIAYSEYNGREWSTPVYVSDTGSGDFGFPRVATTANRIVVVWMQDVHGYTGSEILARIWNGSWGGIQNISRTWLTSKHPDVYAGTDGRTYVVWQDASDTHQHPNGSWTDIFEVKMNVDDGGGGWGTAFDVTDENKWIFRAYIAVNSAHNIMVTYYYQSYSAYFASFRNNGSWTAPILASDVGNHHDHDAYWADACAFGDGYLLVYRDIGFQTIYRSASNGAFSQPVLLGSGWTGHPSIDYHAKIGAVAVWESRDAGEIYGMVFDPDSPPANPPSSPGPNPIDKPVNPPMNGKAENFRIPYKAPIQAIETHENRNVFTIQIIKKILWGLPEAARNYSVPMARYRIFKKPSAGSWSLLKEVDGQILQYEDKLTAQENPTIEYNVTGLDSYQSDQYSFIRVSWEANPKNDTDGIKLRFYRIYRKHPNDSGFGLWRVIDAQPIPQEDHAPEIRLGVDFQYGVTAVSESGRESVMAPAVKTMVGQQADVSTPEANSPKTERRRFR